MNDHTLGSIPTFHRKQPVRVGRIERITITDDVRVDDSRDTPGPHGVLTGAPCRGPRSPWCDSIRAIVDSSGSFSQLIRSDSIRQ